MRPFLIDRDSADEAWRQAATLLISEGVEQPSRLGPTKELRHVVVTISTPQDRVTFSRPINPAYAVADLIWILSGATDPTFLTFWNRRIPRLVVDEPGKPLHGAYGFRLGLRPTLSSSAEIRLRGFPVTEDRRCDQMCLAREALKADPASRQVVLQIWDPGRDLPDPRPRSKDIPCNISSLLLARDGRLDWLQISRSTDLVWGLPYDIIHFSAIQELVAAWTGLEVGRYTHVCDSLHVYQEHWSHLESWARARPRSPTVLPGPIGPITYERWESSFSQLVDAALEITDSKSASEVIAVLHQSAQSPPAHHEWLALMAAEVLARLASPEEARATIAEAGEYWATSWRIWRAAKDGA